MKSVSNILALVLAVVGLARGQQPVNVERVKPDCQLYFVLTGATANSTELDNRQVGCTTWTVTYTSSTYTGLSLAVQSAPDAAGVPGAWAAFAGTILSGVNPNVALTQATTSLSGYYPWMRMRLTGGVAAGTIRGVLYGFRERTIQALMGGVVGVPVFCPANAVVTLAGAGTTQIVGLVAGQSIRVCHISLSLTAPSGVTLVRGTGANCAGAPANVSGVYANVTAMALDFGLSPLTITAGNALCVTLAAAVNAGGVIVFAQF